MFCGRVSIFSAASLNFLLLPFFEILAFIPSLCALFASLSSTASAHLFPCYSVLLPPEQPFFAVFFHLQVKQPSENHSISNDTE